MQIQKLRVLELEKSCKEENVTKEEYITDFIFRSGIEPRFLILITRGKDVDNARHNFSRQEN